MQKGDLIRLTEQSAWSDIWKRAIPVGTVLRIRSVQLEYEEVVAEPLNQESGSHWPNASRTDHDPYVHLATSEFEVL